MRSPHFLVKRDWYLRTSYFAPEAIFVNHYFDSPWPSFESELLVKEKIDAEPKMSLLLRDELP
jgi:hypothetical protein